MSDTKSKLTYGAQGVKSHIYYAGPKRQCKTVCTSAVLAAMGIDQSNYKYSGKRGQAENIMRRFGYDLKRVGVSKRGESVGQIRKKITADRHKAYYYAVVTWSNKAHAILLNSNGETIVDTARRKHDRRNVERLYKVTRPECPNAQCDKWEPLDDFLKAAPAPAKTQELTNHQGEQLSLFA